MPISDQIQPNNIILTKRHFIHLNQNLNSLFIHIEA